MDVEGGGFGVALRQTVLRNATHILVGVRRQRPAPSVRARTGLSVMLRSKKNCGPTPGFMCTKARPSCGTVQESPQPVGKR